MPKQEGNFKMKGKMNGQSFFYTKNGGYQVRNINPNMSERVKTEAAFTNTRKCAAEFGAAAKSASQMVGAIVNRWRYMLVPDAVAKITKIIYDFMTDDTTSPWGQRVITTEGQATDIQYYFTRLTKNPFYTQIGNQIIAQNWVDETSIPGVLTTLSNVTTDANFEELLLNDGANAVQFLMYTFSTGLPRFVDDSYRINQCVIENIPITRTPIVRLDGEGGHTIMTSGTFETYTMLNNSASRIGGLFVVMLPMKIVGGTTLVPKFNVLQRLCSATWMPIRNTPYY